MNHDSTLEQLFARYSRAGDLDALAEVFDRVAPDLERLARRLVTDRHRAEDLVQATFLVALERPGTFEAGRPLRPWLLGILVHRASAARRDTGRTPDADRLEARRPETPLERADAEESREVVERAIADLPPKLRRVVEAKLIDRRDTADLAEELAISRGALRVRLHRGLERLRRALPPSLATGFALTFIHSRGLAQVRSRVLDEAARHSVATGATAAVGAGALSKKLAVGLGVLSIAVICATVAMIDPPTSSAGEEQVTLELEPVSRPVATNTAASGPARTSIPPEVARATTGTGTVAARVTRPDGSPAGGLDVVVRHAEIGGVEESRGLTDDAGIAEVTLPAGTRLYSVELLPTSTTTSDKEWTRRRLADGERVEVDLRVTDGRPLAGVVVDSDGRPVPGAEVLGWNGERNSGPPDRVVTADANGAFLLEHLGPEFVATARHDGLACARGLRGSLSDRVEATGLRIELVPEQRLHGVVLDPSRIPVEGAVVTVSNGVNYKSAADVTHVAEVTTFLAGRGSATTDAQGRFEIRGLPRSTHNAGVDHPPFLRWSEQCELDDAGVEVVLQTGRILRGRVLDAAGRPAPTARVRTWPAARAIEYDDEGGFIARGLSVLSDSPFGLKSYAVAARLEGHAIQVVQPVEVRTDGTSFLDLRLEREQIVAGRVIDTEGRPIAGVELWIEGDREMDSGAKYPRRSTWEFCNGLDEAKTDEEGRFRFTRLYPGTFTVHAVSPEDEHQSVELVTRAPNESVELVLDPSAMRKVVLTGEVRDSSTGEPIRAFTVLPFIDGGARGKGFESADGSFEFVGLAPGPITIAVDAPGYAQRRLPAREFTIGEHDLAIDLAPARRVEVRVVDEHGAAYTSAAIEVRDRTGERVWIETGGGMRMTAASYLNDHALMHGLPGELLTFQVAVGTRDEQNVHEFPVDLTHPLDGPLELVVPRKPEERRVSASIYLLEIDAGGDLEEAERRAPAIAQGEAADPEDTAWLTDAFRAETLRFDIDGTVRLEIRDQDRVVAEATIRRTESGQYHVEESTHYALFGGRSEGSSSSNELPAAMVSWNLLRAKRVELHVTSDVHESRILPLDLGSPRDSTERFLVLRRL